MDFPHFYPQLILYHTEYEPVQYKARQKFVDLVSFFGFDSDSYDGYSDGGGGMGTWL